MSNGIWVSPTQFVDFADMVDKSELTEEIASRQAAWDWTGFMGLLPDPDPILRKLGNGAEILEGLTADGHLCSVIQSRKLGTLKKEFNWEPGTIGEDKPTRQAKLLSARLAEDLERVDLYNLLSGILDAPLYGMTPIEISWAPGNDRLRITNLEAKPSRWFGYNDKNEPRFVSMHNQWDGQELPFGKFVMARHFPTYDNPFGLRLLSRCFWPVVFKKGGIKFWVTLAEKWGMPFLIGQYRPGAPKAEQQDMLSKLIGMVRDACAVIPQGGTVQVLESGKGSGSAEIHSGLKAAMDAEMSKVIMGQTLTAEVSDKGGSRAQGQVHEDILEDFRQGDQTLVKIVMEEIAWVYGQVNAPGVPSPKFNWFEEDEPQTEMAERDKTLQETGVKFRKSYYMRTYRLQEDDFDLAEEKPPADKPTDPPEGENKTAEAEFTEKAAPAVDPSDLLADKLGKTAMATTDPWINHLQQLTMAATSLEDLRESIIAAYGQMDPAELGDMIAQAMTLADLSGRSEVQDGN